MIKALTVVSIVILAGATLAVLAVMYLKKRREREESFFHEPEGPDGGFLDDDDDLRGTILLTRREKPATRTFAEYDEETNEAVAVQRVKPENRGKFVIKNIDIEMSGGK